LVVKAPPTSKAQIDINDKEATAMTQFQESVTARKLATSGRAGTAPFLAITAGLVALLMALAVMSFTVAERPSVPIGGTGDTAAAERYVAGLIAGINQHRIQTAQQVRDGWEAAPIRSEGLAVDGYTQWFLNDD
jgi:hypothetical protein